MLAGTQKIFTQELVPPSQLNPVKKETLPSKILKEEKKSILRSLVF